MQEKIWLSSPHMCGEEQKYIQLAFDENYISPVGSNIIGFENELGEYLDMPNVVALNSGTSAIHLALILLGVKAGDEVIASSFTFSATVNPIVYQGATPILVDCEKSSWNISPVLLEQAIQDRISKGKTPKAIIAVHLYGMPANMDEILRISQLYGIPVIEDAAEAFGSRFNGKSCGSFGDFSILSFNGNKIITTSGGGALLSRSEEDINKARYLATQARDEAPHYQHSQIGYNYRMSNVVAGIGRGQLKVIDERVEQRRAIHNYYFKEIGQIKGISFLKENEKAFSNYWLTTLLVDPQETGGISREDLRLALEQENIESRPLWKPMHLQPVFNNYPAYVDGTSELLFEQGLCLPSGSNMTEEQKQRVVNCIHKTLS